jgi:hypothetical protein
VNAQMFTFRARSTFISLLLARPVVSLTMEEKQIVDDRETNDLR